MIFTPAQIKERVDRGFRLLTRDQREKIDLGKLDMCDGMYCIVGQLFHGYLRGASALFELPIESVELDQTAEAHGFYVCGCSNTYTNYAALQREWTRRLENEREIAELLAPVGSF